MVHMVHFFVFQGCLYFVPWDTLVVGHFVDAVSSMCTSVIYVYQCHTCVIHVYQCYMYVPGTVTGCQGSLYQIFGTILHRIFCLF